MNPIPPDCKACDKPCRIQYSHTVVTDVYYPPTFDKNGVNVNPDGNVSSGSARCTTCDKTWKFATQFGKTDWVRLGQATL